MKVINLFSGAGAGKSTTAAGLFHFLKLRNDLKVELVDEYAKEVVWEQNESKFKDQLYITAQQNRKLYRLLEHNLDYAITDSPLLLGLVYKDTNYFKSFNTLVDELFNSYDNVNILLTRVKKYQKYGRSQTEEEAKQVDIAVRNLLIEKNLSFTEVVGDASAPAEIMKLLGL